MPQSSTVISDCLKDMRNCLLSQKTSIAVALDLLKKNDNAVMRDVVENELNMIYKRNEELQQIMNCMFAYKQLKM